MWSAEQRRIALFPGTFDPFTLGHQSLVKRVLTCVDAVVIAIGINEKKQTYYTLEQRVSAIQRLYANEPRVKVITYSGLTVDAAQQEGASFILRGVRSVIDFEFEKSIADVNRQLTGLETLLLFTEPAYAHISSSVVRELLHFGKDVSAFVPKEIQLY
ncbi:MAG: pantetheine-phosphate adenylyltransferase [Parabacteroides sp.]